MSKKRRILTREDIDMEVLIHYIKTTRLLNPPNGIIPPSIDAYKKYEYLLDIHQPYNRKTDYWGKSIDLIRKAVIRTLKTWNRNIYKIDRVGIYLGGFDSALLLKLTGDIIGPEKVRGYNVVWSENKDESAYVRELANFTGSKVIINKCTARKVIPLIREATLLLRAPAWGPQTLYVAKLCAKDGTNKAFIGLGLDALSGGEFTQAKASNQAEFDKATLHQMDLQRRFIWANVYPSRGYVDLKTPYFDSRLVKYMLGLPRLHKCKDGKTRFRLRAEVADLKILPKSYVSYGEVAGTKKGFGPDWREYFTYTYPTLSNWKPELYLDLHKVNKNYSNKVDIRRWERANIWVKLMMMATCEFFKLIDEGKFYV